MTVVKYIHFFFFKALAKMFHYLKCHEMEYRPQDSVISYFLFNSSNFALLLSKKLSPDFVWKLQFHCNPQHLWFALRYKIVSFREYYCRLLCRKSLSSLHSILWCCHSGKDVSCVAGSRWWFHCRFHVENIRKLKHQRLRRRRRRPRKRHLKTLSRLFHLVQCVKWWQIFLELNS